MIRKYFLSFLFLVALFSCSKDKQANTYIVNAGKIIWITGNNWMNVESQLRTKVGYSYILAPASSGIKAEVHLPALDDSNRNVNGTFLLNTSHDNRVQVAMLTTDPVSQPVAYAMIMNYHGETLRSITGITSARGGLIENAAGSNPPVSTVLSKLTSGQIADQLSLTYDCAQGSFTMVIFKRNDGSFIFSYRGSK
jgi:hypothetical protein